MVISLVNIVFNFEFYMDICFFGKDLVFSFKFYKFDVWFDFRLWWVCGVCFCDGDD